MIRKIILITLLVILLLLLLITGGSYLLLGTDSGFRLTTSKLKDFVPQLSIEPTSGNLESGVTTDHLSWEQDGLAVNIRGLKSKWSSICLLQYRYCLDKLNVDTIEVKTRPVSSTSDSGGGPVQLPEVKLPVAIEANEVTISELILDLSAESPPIVVKDIQLKASMNGTKLDVDWLIANYGPYSARFGGTVKLKDEYALQGNLDVTAREMILGEDVHASLALSQTVTKLKVEGTVTGAVDLRLAGSVEPLQPRLPVDAVILWDSIGWPLDSRSTVETRDARLAINGNLDDYALTYQTTLTGQHIPESKIDLAGVVNTKRILLPTIDLLSLGGYATGSAAANWEDSITWVADIITKEINPGLKWQNMDGQLNSLVQANGIVKDGTWSLNLPKVDVGGSFRNFPLDLQSRLTKSSDDTWQVEAFELAVGPNTLSLQGSYAEQLDFDAAIAFPAVHYLTPLVVGEVNAEAAISGSVQEPSISIAASSSLLKAGKLLFRDLRLDSTINQAGNQPSTLKLTVNNLNANGQILRNMTASLDGTREAHSLSAFADGPNQSSVKFKLAGALAENFDWRGSLQSSAVELPANLLKLSQPTALAWVGEDKRFNIDAHCWTMQDAKLCLQNKLSAGADGNAVIGLSNYSLKYLNPFLPATAQLSGTLNAKADLMWSDDSEQAFSATLDSNIKQGEITVTDDNLRKHKFEYQTLTLDASADPGTVNANLAINSKAMGNGKVSFTMNPNSANQSIAGDVALRGFNIGFLQAFMPGTDDIGGDLNVRGSINGSLSDPVFDGRVSLVDTVFRSPDLPLSIDGGTVGANIQGDQAKLDGKLISKDGSITLGGTANWKNNIPSADITLKGESLSIKQSPVVTSSVFPDLRIRFTSDKLAVTGNIGIPLAVIDIKDLPEGTTSLSDDVIIIEDESIEAAPANPAPIAIDISVGVNLGEKVQLSGYGLKANLQGDFKVNKKGEEPPQLNGEVLVTEGLYKSYGQDLTIKDGQILFVGPIERTTLNIDAVRVIETGDESRVAGLHLEGPIADPVVTLFTIPADKSQESILSYIVLGRDIGSENTTSEANLLASAALALTLKQGRGFATEFAESLGIRDFALEADGSGDETQVVVSGRLSSRLILRYGRSVFSNDDTLFLRYDLSKKLYLEAAQGIERAVDVFYSFSF